MKSSTNHVVWGLGLATVILGFSGSTARAQVGFSYVSPRFGIDVGVPGPVYPGYGGVYYGYPPAVVAPPMVYARPPVIVGPPVVAGRPYYYGGYRYGYPAYGRRYYRR